MRNAKAARTNTSGHQNLSEALGDSSNEGPVSTDKYGLPTRGNDDVPSRAEVAQGQGQVEWVIVAPGDAWCPSFPPSLVSSPLHTVSP